MAKPVRPWIVTPHDPIVRLEDNLWAVEAAHPEIPIRRRMGIVRRRDGTLLFYNAIPLEPRALDEVLSFGKPAVLVVPHDNHGFDARAFADKLGAKIHGPRRNDAAFLVKFPMRAGFIEGLPADPDISFEPLDGTRKGEPVMIVRSGARVSLMFADAYQDHTGASHPLVMRLAGFRGGPKVVPFFKLAFTSDKRALRSHFERLAALPGLVRLIPSHGPIRTEDPAGTLRAVAAGM